MQFVLAAVCCFLHALACGEVPTVSPDLYGGKSDSGASVQKKSDEGDVAPAAEAPRSKPETVSADADAASDLGVGDPSDKLVESDDLQDEEAAKKETVAEETAPAEDAPTEIAAPCNNACDIEGKCFLDKDKNPLNPCEICDFAFSHTQWTWIAGCCTSSDVCGDQNLCTADACIENICVHSPLVCDDQNSCTDNACEGGQGCVYAPNDKACDDEDPHTLVDACTEGVCVGTMWVACLSDADCPDDGNLCNGYPHCAPEGACAIDPATVVACPEAGQCTHAKCDAQTGECLIGNIENGGACDDESACTTDDACADGACAGTPVSCDDGDECTDDSCDPKDGCVQTANASPCNDGDACTNDDACSGGACKGMAVVCNDGDECTDDGCEPLSGCVFAFNSLPCNDNDACTEDDTCANGVCGGTPVVCDDGDPCTIDSCESISGCVSALDNEACPLDNTVGGGSDCDVSGIVPATPLPCVGHAKIANGPCGGWMHAPGKPGQYAYDVMCTDSPTIVSTVNGTVLDTRNEISNQCSYESKGCSGECPDWCCPGQGCKNCPKKEACGFPDVSKCACDSKPVRVAQGHCPADCGPADWGNFVLIQGTDGANYLFPHGKKGTVKVQKNEEACTGLPLLEMGETGVADGLHVHYARTFEKGGSFISEPLKIEYALDGKTFIGVPPLKTLLTSTIELVEACCPECTTPGFVIQGPPTCTPVTNGTACADDGSPCTEDHCQEGFCTHPIILTDCIGIDCGISPKGCYDCGTCPDGYVCSIERKCVSTSCTECKKFDGTGCVALPQGSICPDDGNLCTMEYCEYGACVHSQKAAGTSCGNGYECSSDGKCISSAWCGNGECNQGETFCSCPNDNCPVKCGDNCCTAGQETYCTCPTDCPIACGDTCCSAGETCSSCQSDCGQCPPQVACGDDVCTAGSETAPGCPSDCGCAAVGSCGNDSPSGCWCDVWCYGAGDCCPDACSVCGMGQCTAGSIEKEQCGFCQGSRTRTCTNSCTWGAWTACKDIPAFDFDPSKQCGNLACIQILSCTADTCIVRVSKTSGNFSSNPVDWILKDTTQGTILKLDGDICKNAYPGEEWFDISFNPTSKGIVESYIQLSLLAGPSCDDLYKSGLSLIKKCF